MALVLGGVRAVAAVVDTDDRPLFAAGNVATKARTRLGGMETSVRHNGRVSEPLGAVSYAAYGRQVSLANKRSV